MKYVHKAAYLLVIIGALNWAVFAVTGWEIGSLFGGMDSAISKAIYIIAGLSAVYVLLEHSKTCKVCTTEKGSAV